ncbi:DegT/DnrJ/EryC1/StrS family aminotransferase [Rufibacter psychrotolerans]|uniref:DegT/DnrJ/EryC1/StrS family aminotransferase n=1 Tax=Rufibacter psychrotolerans TaxID=2812556 RepID=UPI001968931B|nr:DegT/DnrJ/EryC1/StrS family aminotransferase [Rufibacter sp. SYSU D00308]
MRDIPIFNTFIHPSAQSRVDSVLSSTFLSEGKLVKEFESKLNSDLGFVNPLALNSGTSALHLAVVLAGVKPGDEVICPAQTFVATALVICQEKAIPVFADIKYEDGNIDPKSIEEKVTSKTKAIIAVHWGGNPCDMDEIHAIAKRYNLVVIEDAAHAPGATYKSRPVGSISDFTCFSFQAIKHITTGDGGAICCKDDKVAMEALKRRWFGINRANSPLSILGERIYDITDVGYKYHLNDYGAALGLANLEGFKDRLAYRRKLVQIYRQELSQVSGLNLFKESNDRESAHWLFGFHVEKREEFILTLKSKGIAASVVHDGIDHNSLFGGTRQDLVNQLRFNETQIHIPIHDGMNEEDVEYIVNCIKQGW